MNRFQGLVPAVLAILIVVTVSSSVDAAIARYHYVPVDATGMLQLQSGEKTSVFGRVPDDCPPPATCLVPFKHCITGQTLLVPLALPPDTPIIYHRSNRIVYSYGSYTVTVQFLQDGSVDVIYNSGWLRAV
ncbi:MAG: hypothetical protein AB7K24_06245 [Gemmataceae bacterium]